MFGINSRGLPDPEISLREARDFVLSSALARRALIEAKGQFALFLHDLLEAIYRLVQSCHLPEFTDHGLPHLCSLVDRISRWELPSNSNDELLCEALSPREASLLLIATLIHDIGMLSQNPIDLPDDAPSVQSKSQWPDVATWVRVTHVGRIEKLVLRVLPKPREQEFLKSDLFQTALSIARSHEKWPWDWDGQWINNQRSRGLAAVLAVADLLDEDSARCDTATLLEHREGSELNRAHWLRHALTANRVLVKRGRIRVEMTRPPETTDAIKPVYSALRNHFRLVSLYEHDLKHLGAPVTNVDLVPSTGLPDQIASSLDGWTRIHGFATESSFCFQMLRTFMPVVLKRNSHLDEQTIVELRRASLEDVETALLDSCDGTDEPRTSFEKTFRAMANEQTNQ